MTDKGGVPGSPAGVPGSPAKKLTQGLLRGMSQVKADERVPIIVLYKPTRRVMRHRERVRGLTESYSYHLRPFVHMHAIPEAIRRLQDDPDIVKIYEDLPVHAYLDTSVPHIQVPRLWDEGLNGEGVRIAIIDTGIDAGHPDFEGRIVDTADFTGEGPEDGHGHGTHCASIAAGSGASSEGKYRGVAPQASIYTAKVLRSDGSGMMSDVMAGIDWAVDQGIQIISLSLGGPGPCDGNDALCKLCDAAVEQGAVIVVAAGNDGPGAYTVGSPGCARNVITVGASTDQDRVALFSSHGPTVDGRLKPDILLPGTNIVAARAEGTSLGTVVNQYYISASGTSMATPHAAGVCALLLQANPDLTPEEIKSRLTATAVDLGDTPYAQGKGRVDAWKAQHASVQPSPEPEPVLPGPGPAPGQGCLPAILQMLFIGRKRK